MERSPRGPGGVTRGIEDAFRERTEQSPSFV